MFKTSICIEMIFNEIPFINRINKVKEANVDAFEFWSWQNKDLASIKDIVKKTGLKISAFIGSGTELTDPKKMGKALMI